MSDGNGSGTKGNGTPESKLGAEQETALAALAQGKSITDAAQACGVSRRTLHRWLQSDADFQAAYDQWHQEMREHCRSRLLMMWKNAIRAIELALRKGDSRTALELLKGMGLLIAAPDPAAEAAENRREKKLERRIRDAERDWERGGRKHRRALEEFVDELLEDEE